MSGQEKDRFIVLGRNRVHATRILVRFKDNAPAPQREAILAQNGLAALRRNLGVPGLVTLDLKKGPVLAGAPAGPRQPPTVELSARIAALKASGLFAYVEPDYEIRANELPSDLAFVNGALWGLLNTGQSGGVAGIDVGVTNAWNLTTGSTNVIVAIIDSGIRYTHADLAAQMWRNPGEVEGNGVDDDGDGYVDNVFGINAILGTGDPMDDNDHGTHVAGTIGAAANDGHPHVGIAWQVRLMACKFIDASGGGSTSDAIECIQFAVSHGAKILNNSWGDRAYSQALFDAIVAARNQGVLFVAAAGNSGSNHDFSPEYPASYPIDNILVVAALDRTGELAGFSSYGSKSVHLGAPGVEIYSSTAGGDNEYQYLQGTSMATPHVSGVAALVRAFYPNISLLELRQRLLLGSEPTPSLLGKTTTGGRVNAYKALTIAPSGKLELVLSPSGGSPLYAGTTVPLSVQVYDLLAVTNAIVTANISGLTNLTFLDNGLGPDLTANDGVYSANLLIPTNVSQVSVVVDATAPDKNPGSVSNFYFIAFPPANDAFTNRIAIPTSPTPVTVTGKNFFATIEPGEPTWAFVPMTGTVWWHWTAPTNGTATILTTGSSFENVLAVYRGTGFGALTLLGIDDDDGGGVFTSSVTFPVTAATDYPIAVGGFMGSEGNIQLTVIFTPPLTNDAFAARIPIDGLNTSVFGTNFGASSEAGEPVHAGIFGGQSLWWTWTAPSNVTVTLSTAGSTLQNSTYPLNTMLAVYLGDELVNLTLVASNDNASATIVTSQLTFNALAGACYQIAVDSYPSGAGTIMLNLVTPPPNDNFVDRLHLSGAFVEAVGYNILAGKEPGEPAHADDPGGSSVWWTWTPPEDGRATITTEGSSFDTTLGVYLGNTVDALSLVASNDDVGQVPISQVTFDAAAGTPYQIAVDGFQSQDYDQTGLINLNITLNGSSRIIRARPTTNGVFQLTVHGEPSSAYALECSTNLTDWIPLMTNGLSGRSGLFADPGAANSTPRFYRTRRAY